MPKYVDYKLLWNAKTRRYEFRKKDMVESTVTIISNEHDLQTSIKGICSFAFEGQHGTCTVRTEARQRGGKYWYAYRRRNNKMNKRYLGRSSNLTIFLLELTTRRLLEEPEQWLGPSPGTRRGGSFSEILEEFRLAKGLTKKDLARGSNLTPGYISLLTRGERTFPSRDTINSLATTLGLSAKDRTKLFEAAGYYHSTSIK